MPFGLAEAGQALKIMFEDPITDQVIAKSDLLDWFEQNANVKTSQAGRYIEVSNIYGDPEGVGARAEKDYIPVALDPAFVNQQIYLKYIYGTVEMTMQVMKQMAKGRAAFISWADATLRRLERAVRNDVDRMLFGFGAGIIARVNDPSPDATLGVGNAYGVTGIGNAASLFRINARYRFFQNANATGPRTGGGVVAPKVTAINRASQIVTFDAVPSDIANGDYIVRGDAVSHSGQLDGVNREIMGLLGHVDDGSVLATYFGLSRANYEFLKSTVINGAAAPYNGNLTETLLMYANDEVAQYGGGDPDAIVTTRGALRNFFAQLRSDRTFNDPRSFTGGSRDLQIMLGDKTLTLRASRQCPAGTLFLLDRSTLMRFHNTGWEWDDSTGAVFKQVVDANGRKDVFYAFGRWYLETFNRSPQQSARIYGISESVA